jgi:hypothetical protein
MISYVCSPYSHCDPAVRQERFEAACRAAAELTRQGTTVYCPVAHTHAIAKYGLPLNWDYWQIHDRRFLEMCSEVVVLTLPGWRDSVGVTAEIEIARALGKPVSFLRPAGRPEEGLVD